jgi:hypothetical protein
LTEEAARRRAEEEARRTAEAQARNKAEEESRLRAEIEAQMRAEAAERRRAEDEARRQAEEEARRRAEEEAQRWAAEQARRRAEEEAQRLAQAEARRLAEEAARVEAAAEAQRQAEIQARLRAEQAVRNREEAEKRERAELEKRIRAEIEAKLRAEDEQRRREEAAARERAEYERLAPEEASQVQATSEFSFALDEFAHDHPAGQSPNESSPRTTEINEWFDLPAESRDEIPELPDTSPEQFHSQDRDDSNGEFRAISVDTAEAELSSQLEAALQSRDAAERAAALADLPQIGGEEAYQHITAAFDDSSPEVRSAAARALFQLQEDRAAAFTRALREATPDRRRAIGAAIGSSGLASEAMRNLTGESRDKTYDAFSLLFLMSKAGEVRPLMRAIEEHPNTEVRLAVVKLLALSGQAEVLSAFRRMAVRGSLPAEVRSTVMDAIYQMTSQSPADAGQP